MNKYLAKSKLPENNRGKKLVFLLLTAALLLNACKEKETKYCYFIDARGYVDKYVVCGENIEQAKLARKNYLEIRNQSIREFNATCSQQGLRFIKGKWPVEILKNYPADGIKKVKFRFQESSLADRIDSRVSIVYLPTFLLHDSLLENDTVKYTDY